MASRGPLLHTLPQPGPVLESATSSRQLPHRYTRLSRVRLEVGLFRALEGSGSGSVASCSAPDLHTLGSAFI